MLEHCELVVINPMLGPKKAGDIDTEKLNGLYEKVLKQRYKNKIEFEESFIWFHPKFTSLMKELDGQ